MNYTFTVQQQLITCDQSYIVADSVEFCQATFQFDSTWDGYNKTVLFTNLTNSISRSVLLDETNSCYIPWEVLKYLGRLNVFVRGDKQDSIATTARMCCPMFIYKSGASADADFENMPSPDIYKQLLNRLQLVETGGLTAEQFNTFLIENEEYLGLSSQIHQNTANIANLTTQVGEIDEGVHLLDERVQGIGAILGQHTEQFTTVQESIEKNAEQIALSGTEISNLQNSMNTALSGYNNLSSDVTSLTNRTTTLEEKVTDLEAGIKDDDTDPSVPDAEFQKLKKQVAQNTIDIETNTKDTQTALTDSAANTTQIDINKQNIQSNSELIAQNTAKIETLNSNVANLQSTLETVQSEITSIQSQLVSPTDEEVQNKISEILSGGSNG